MLRQLDNLINEYKDLLPLNEDVQKKLDLKFRLEFNYNSNHLEGNTLTYGETKLLLIFDQVKSNHEMRELEEMKAHDVALMMIKQESKEKSKPLTERFIKELNQTILVQDFWKDAITADGQNTRRKIKVGNYKEYPNSVIQSNGEVFEYASPQDTPILMAQLVQWYNGEVEKDEFSAVQLAALLHYRFIRIHPFDDGNGRVARLLVNYVLCCFDLPPLIIKTDDKRNYLRALQQADAGDIDAFVEYMINQLAWSVDISIRAAKGEDIEDQNDWEKQLSLLKRGLGDSGNKAIRKSPESVKNILTNSLMPLAKLFDEKLSMFESLFIYVFHYIMYNGNNFVGNKSVYEAILDLSEIKENLDGIDVWINYQNFRYPYKTVSVFSIPLSFVFKDDVYTVKYEQALIVKEYSELLSENEINEIVSFVAKDLLTKIEPLSKED